MDKRVADLRATEFNERVADPGIFSGGGSVAAMAAAGAAATALLVMRLNHRRRSNAGSRRLIEDAMERVTAAIHDFYAAADEDVTILDELLEAQRAARREGDLFRYHTALAEAAASPLRIGERIQTLLDVIDTQLPITSRFTISDLGAAAALADGACRAALMTAEVNIALLREAQGSDPRTTGALEERLGAIHDRVTESARRIEHITRERIAGREIRGDRGDASRDT